MSKTLNKNNAKMIFQTINADFELHRAKHKLYEQFGRQKALKKFDRKKAAKPIRKLVLSAAKKYRLLQKIPAKAMMFSLDDMSETIEILIKEFLKEWKQGQLDYTIPKSAWKKRGRN